MGQLNEKLNTLPDFLLNKIPEECKISKSTCPKYLSESAKYVIDYCLLLHTVVEKLELERPINELRKNILHLILTEYHYSRVKNHNVDSSILYLNKLDSLIHSKNEVIKLKEFLDQLLDYCTEYYSELKIKYVIEENSSTDFISNQAFLAEAIFSIFTTIIRIGNLCVDDAIILKVSFENSNLPSFNFEVIIHEDGHNQSIGWELGQLFAYNGLLPVYLLAKENNYFFYLLQDADKIIFKL
ncbi:MAG: hypothetical protein AABY27_02640, partial [Pseudomonadota bacterium]